MLADHVIESIKEEYYHEFIGIANGYDDLKELASKAKSLGFDGIEVVKYTLENGDVVNVVIGTGFTEFERYVIHAAEMFKDVYDVRQSGSGWVHLYNAILQVGKEDYMLGDEVLLYDGVAINTHTFNEAVSKEARARYKRLAVSEEDCRVVSIVALLHALREFDLFG